MRRRSFLTSLPMAAASPALAADAPGAPGGSEGWAQAAAAPALALASARSANVVITGSGEIRSFGPASDGLERTLRFEADVLLVHDAARLVLPNGGLNLLCQAGDCLSAVCRGGDSWVVSNYQPANVITKLDRRASKGALAYRWAVGGGAATEAPDFAVEGGYDRTKVVMKSAMLNDPGDTPEIGLMIADGTAAAPRPWQAPYPGAFIYGWPRDATGTSVAQTGPGFGDAQWLGRNAQITFAIAETPTPTARGGALVFGVCPRGRQVPVDRGWFGPRGGFVLSGRALEGALAAGRVKYPWQPAKAQEKYHPAPGLNWYDYQDDATLTLIASDTADNKVLSIRRDDDLGRGAGLDYVAASDELRLGRVAQGRFTAAWSWTARGDQAPAADRGADLGEPARRVRTVHADAIDVRRAAKGPAALFHSEAPDANGDVLTLSAAADPGAGFSFLKAVGEQDDVVRIDGAGGVAAAGWSGQDAGFGEYMEWADGNPGGEDRVGWSVVIEDGRIRRAGPSDPADEVVGVISARASLVGAAAWSHWSGKYLADDFGRPITRPVQYVRWREPISEEQTVQVARATRERVMAPRREAVEVVERLPRLCEVDGRWIRTEAEVRRTVERPVLKTVLVHDERHAPMQDACGAPLTLEVPLEEELEVERLEAFAQPVRAELGHRLHCYPVHAVPSGLAVPVHAERFAVQEKVLNPLFDPARAYTPRRDRPEWDVVALRGQVKVLKGERTGSRWIRMGPVSDAVEQWLLR
jgi:hypothetical protein